jgi:hypothetical protein
MSTFDPTPYRPRNPVTHQRHKRETRLQIMLPILLGTVIIVGIGILITLRASIPAASKMADISLIWLIMPASLFTLIGAIVVGGLAYLVIRLVAILPYQFYRLMDLLLRLHRLVVQVSDKLTAPVIKVMVWKASYDRLRQRSSRPGRYR